MSTRSLPPLPQRRQLVNSFTKHLVFIGGASVIGAITLLMTYLIWVVVPIFKPASVELVETELQLPSDVIRVESNDRFDTLAVIRSSGVVDFIDAQSFETKSTDKISQVPILQIVNVFPTADVFAGVNSDQEMLFFRLTYLVRYIDGVRTLVNHATMLFDEVPVELPDNVSDIDVYWESKKVRIAIRLDNGNIVVSEYLDVDESFALEEERSLTIEGKSGLTRIQWGPQGHRLFDINLESGTYRLLDIRSIRRYHVASSHQFVSEGTKLTTYTPLLGRYSLLVADDAGDVTQWGLQTQATGATLTPIRKFSFESPITMLTSEHRRKGFLAVADNGESHVAHTTSEKVVASFLLKHAPQIISLSPRADKLVTVDSLGNTEIYKIDNPHPEIAWGTIWNKVWYEGYETSVFSWQSSSADTAFEPKFSLTPLLFGTLKAAFYAMLFATPLAILGAIYTANFMAPRMRQWVKPSIETMAALPTVVLGFLAGLWLAPIVEANLTSVLLCIIVLPLSVLVFGFLWSLLPSRMARAFDGWLGALSVPILILAGYVTFSFDELLSVLLFGGDARAWFYQVLELEYDQRNSLIIGIAMGLAVIPTIFSIAEDALYGVPQHLVHGSLALGATRWQTLVRIVLLTASPGIFSAVMIGFGRAAGETMIVLMATGNTPIMDLNIFQGMRTFAANIAVEMPESEVDSTHFRILFLTALVLFAITLAFNTVAEVVRHRLRSRYGNL